MHAEYIKFAMQLATYKLLDGGEGYFGEILRLQSLWVNAPTLEACQVESSRIKRSFRRMDYFRT